LRAATGVAELGVLVGCGDKTKQFIIETTGSGAAFLDYDNDGLLDIFIMSGQGGLAHAILDARRILALDFMADDIAG